MENRESTEKKKMKNILIIVGLLLAIIATITFKKNEKHEIASTSVQLDSTVENSISDDLSSNVKTDMSATPNLPVLKDFGAGKCIPCKMMEPILDELKKEFNGEFAVEFTDVWKNPDVSKKYGIKVIPTQIFFTDEGVEIFRHEGFYSKDDILNKWKEFGYTFESKQSEN